MPQLGPAARDIWWVLLMVLIGRTALMGYNISLDARNDAAVRHSLIVLNDWTRLPASVTDSETGVSRICDYRRGSLPRTV